MDIKKYNRLVRIGQKQWNWLLRTWYLQSGSSVYHIHTNFGGHLISRKRNMHNPQVLNLATIW